MTALGSSFDIARPRSEVLSYAKAPAVHAA
jgi:hypothetical protein